MTLLQQLEKIIQDASPIKHGDLRISRSLDHGHFNLRRLSDDLETEITINHVWIERIELHKNYDNIWVSSAFLEDVVLNINEYISPNKGPLTSIRHPDYSYDNPLFSIEYAYCRCQSVVKYAQEPVSSKVNIEAADNSLINLVYRLSYLHSLAVRETDQINIKALTSFLYDFAQDFHKVWNNQIKGCDMRFISPNQPEKTKAHLAILQAISFFIAFGLNVLGYEPCEEMS